MCFHLLPVLLRFLHNIFVGHSWEQEGGDRTELLHFSQQKKGREGWQDFQHWGLGIPCVANSSQQSHQECQQVGREGIQQHHRTCSKNKVGKDLSPALSLQPDKWEEFALLSIFRSGILLRLYKKPWCCLQDADSWLGIKTLTNTKSTDLLKALKMTFCYCWSVFWSFCNSLEDHRYPTVWDIFKLPEVSPNPC